MGYRKAPSFIGKSLTLHVGRGDMTIEDHKVYSDDRLARFVGMGFLVEDKPRAAAPVAAPVRAAAPAPVRASAPAPAVVTNTKPAEAGSEEQPVSRRSAKRERKRAARSAADQSTGASNAPAASNADQEMEMETETNQETEAETAQNDSVSTETSSDSSDGEAAKNEQKPPTEESADDMPTDPELPATAAADHGKESDGNPESNA